MFVLLKAASWDLTKHIRLHHKTLQFNFNFYGSIVPPHAESTTTIKNTSWRQFKHLSNLQSCNMDTSKLQLSGFMKTIEGGNKTIALLFLCRRSSSGASSSWGRRRISWGSFPSSVSQMQMPGSQWRAIQGGTVKIKLLQPQKSIFFSRWPQTDKSQKSAK